MICTVVIQLFAECIDNLLAYSASLRPTVANKTVIQVYTIVEMPHHFCIVLQSALLEETRSEYPAITPERALQLSSQTHLLAYGKCWHLSEF